MANRCEDYPCCGHTDGLGCNYTPDYDYIYAHLGCDHEAGIYECDEPYADDYDDVAETIYYDNLAAAEQFDADMGIEPAGWEDSY